MGNVTLGGFSLASIARSSISIAPIAIGVKAGSTSVSIASPGGPFDVAGRKRAILIKRIGELDALIAKKHAGIVQLKNEIDRLVSTPGAPNVGYAPITMTPQAKEQAYRNSIVRLENEISNAELERSKAVALLEKLGGTAPLVPVPPVRTAPTPKSVESSPLKITPYQDSAQEEEKAGSMLMPTILIGGAALATFLAFKG